MIGNKRIVLIAGMGNSPQVLTETVWEMAHLKRPLVPDEIVVFAAKNTTAKLRKALLDGETPVWRELIASLKKEKISVDGKLVFGSTSIHVIPDANGDEMQDLRTGEDNLRAADFMLQQIRQYTESPDTVVLVSIAGGRKTMSALLFSCMTLLGREDDKVFHVLMPPEFEGGVEPPFYFPRSGVTHTALKTGRKFKGDKVRSELFEVPFVRMRGWYQEKFKSMPPTYRTLVSKVQTMAPPPVVSPKLEIDFDGSGYVRILPSRTEIRLSAPAFLLVVLIAKGLPKDSWGNELYRLRERLADADFPLTVKWNDRFLEGPKFVKDGTQKENAGDLADCMSELRKKLAAWGFDNPEVLAPKRNGAVTYPLANFTMINEKLIPADIRGCLLSDAGKRRGL